MRKKIYGIATALALAMGCSLFMTYPVQAAETNIFQQDSNGNYILPDGTIFQSIKTLKNGKIMKYYDVEPFDSKGEFLKGKILYDGEEFQFEQYNTKVGACDIENPGYNVLDKSTQKFCIREHPETYFPALTATKKVNELINKYKDPSQHLLPEKVDKTSTTYQEMKTAAEEATKNCKTDYEKIVTLAMYVKSIMTYDISLSGKGLSVEKAWAMKKGVCDQFADIMERLVQIEGIPSVSVGWENKNNYFIGHAYVLSYDKVSKKWICSDPTNGLKDLDVYSQAGQMTNVDQNVAYLKKDDGLFFLTYDKNDAYGNIDYDTWELIDRWGIVLHDADYSNGTDISITSTDFDGIPIVGVSENAFHNNTRITSLSLPSSVEKVESGAFWKTSNLKKYHVC
ncbi:MAG: transglutaminase domain-containing protein [Anaerobutyricum sp.]